MQVIVDTLETNYRRSGEGPIIVLVHGWGESLNTFSGLQKALAQKHDCIALDLPGFGASDPPFTTWDLDDYAGFVADFLQKIGVHEVFAVIGHSNGGAVSIRGVSIGKLKPKKLVLLAPSGIRAVDKLRKGIVKAVAKVGKAATLALPSKARRKIRSKFYNAIRSDALIAEHLSETFKKTVEQDVRSDAKKLDLPVLLIYGADDVDTPPAYGQIFYKMIVGSELQIIKGAAHFVHQDQPEKVIELTRKFLN